MARTDTAPKVEGKDIRAYGDFLVITVEILERGLVRALSSSHTVLRVEESFARHISIH